MQRLLRERSTCNVLLRFIVAHFNIARCWDRWIHGIVFFSVERATVRISTWIFCMSRIRVIVFLLGFEESWKRTRLEDVSRSLDIVFFHFFLSFEFITNFFHVYLYSTFTFFFLPSFHLSNRKSWANGSFFYLQFRGIDDCFFSLFLHWSNWEFCVIGVCY